VGLPDAPVLTFHDGADRWRQLTIERRLVGALGGVEGLKVSASTLDA